MAAIVVAAITARSTRAAYVACRRMPAAASLAAARQLRHARRRARQRQAMTRPQQSHSKATAKSPQGHAEQASGSSWIRPRNLGGHVAWAGDPGSVQCR